MLFRLIFIYARIKPSVVFNFTTKNNIFGVWAAKLNGAKVINNVSGLGTAFISNNLITKMVKILYRLSQPFADRVFCQNSEDMRFLIENGLVAENKLTLLPGSGINVEHFHPRYKISTSLNTPFSFTFVGRMIGDKGVLELLEASKLLYEDGVDIKLTLCGPVGVKNNSAITKTELEGLCNNPCTQWVGESDNIRDVYAKSDCVVLPSYREGLPRTLLEAGGMGLPCIATNVPGCKSVIFHDYNGLLCDPKSVDSLYEAMKVMAQLPSDKLLMFSKNSRSNVVKNFDEEIVIRYAFDALSDNLR
jgi:glycosyltransferase involved in cell wall biosynthesis